MVARLHPHAQVARCSKQLQHNEAQARILEDLRFRFEQRAEFDSVRTPIFGQPRDADTCVGVVQVVQRGRVGERIVQVARAAPALPQQRGAAGQAGVLVVVKILLIVPHAADIECDILLAKRVGQFRNAAYLVAHESGG